MEELSQLNLELWDAAKFRESLWHLKSRLLWLKECDSNMAFFYKVVKIGAKKKLIHGLRFGSDWCKDPKVLKKIFFEYFNNHFNYPRRNWGTRLELNFKRIYEDKELWLE